MLKRRIERRDVEGVIDNYDTSYCDRNGNPCLMGNLRDGRRVRIVIAKDTNPLKIITVIALG